MKAWIISDLHLRDASNRDFPIPDADVCICAGDTSGVIGMSLDFLNRHIAKHMPVVAVLGNHDYYGSSIKSTLEVATRETGGNLTILENATKSLGSVRIIGATLWTDFEVEHGVDDELPLPERKSYSISVCKRYMMDFHTIFRSDWPNTGMPGLLTAQELIARHVESRAFITSELAKPFDGKTVVLTHHAPSQRSLHPQFKGHPSNGAFASDLSDLLQTGGTDIWVHGHVHHYLDYYEGGTRVICNPRGYPREADTGFVPDLVIEI